MGRADEIAEMLRVVEWDRLAISAEVTADGLLKPVGGMLAKLIAAAEETKDLRLIECVVVAEGQDGVEPIMKEPGHLPFRVIEARTLDDAVEALYEEHGPRGAWRAEMRREGGQIDLVDGRAVPLRDLYREPPLLRTIRPEDLPRDDRPGRDRDGKDKGGRPPTAALFEDDLRRAGQVVQKHKLADLFADFRRVVPGGRSAAPRFVALGVPGGGKSTLLRFLAGLAADRELEPGGRPALPALVRLRDWEKSGRPDLADYLADLSRRVHPAPTADAWRRWLRAGDVLLLLDGLDEVDADGMLDAVRDALDRFADCPAVVTCRTLDQARYARSCPGLAAFELDRFDPEARDAYIRAYPAADPSRFDADGLIAALGRNPAMEALAAVPMLLEMICFAVDEPGGIGLPATRVELYDRVVDRLLDRERSGDRSPLNATTRRWVLERAALDLFAESGRQLTFDKPRLLAALTRAARAEELAAPGSQANDLLRDFSHHSGLIRHDAHHGYFFLHLNLHEFLAASALARSGNEPGGWNATIQLGQSTHPLRTWVDRKSWLPAWRQVILMLAGRLADPGPLLELLADPKRDDILRHRLALAGECLAEVPLATRRGCEAAIDLVTTRVALTWRGWVVTGRFGDDLPLARALPAVLRSGGAVGRDHAANSAPRTTGRSTTTPPLAIQEWFVSQLRGGDQAVQMAAAGSLSGAASEPGVADALIDALRDGHPDVRRAAAGSLSGAASRPGVADALVDALRDGDWFVREAAAETFNGAISGGVDPDLWLGHCGFVFDLGFRWAMAGAYLSWEERGTLALVLGGNVRVFRHRPWLWSLAGVASLGGVEDGRVRRRWISPGMVLSAHARLWRPRMVEKASRVGRSIRYRLGRGAS